MTPRAALNALLASDDFHALEARLRRVSAFHILGIEARELSHAALLAWLLDPRASHGMGPEPLRRFILLAARIDPAATVLDAVDVDQLDLTDALIETERWIDVPATDRRRRLDILVSVPVPGEAEPRPILVVEYKVDAAEGVDQTADYARWAATQSLRFGDREVLPLQVYLCPVASDDHAPARPFVTVGYDAYLGWAEGVASLEKTAQASLLLDEWRACLQVRNDVVDEQQEALTAKLERQHREAIQALREARRPDLVEYQHVIDQHADVLAQLGIRVRRRAGQSKGQSAVIALAREVFEAGLSEERWSVGGGAGSLRVVFLPFVREVAAGLGGAVRLSGVRLQLYADRPKNGRLRVVLEVIGDVPGMDRESALAMRLAAAEGVRELLGAVDPTLSLRGRATCLSFDVAMPEVVDLVSDTDEHAATHRAELDAITARVSALEPALVEWSEARLPTLLDTTRESG